MLACQPAVAVERETLCCAVQEPGEWHVSYQYDGAHHVTQRTDAKNQQTQYS